MVYHWIMTVQFTHESGNKAHGCYNGVTNPLRPGTTRAQLYQEILDVITQQNGGLKDCIVLFFSLEKNEL